MLISASYFGSAAIIVVKIQVRLSISRCPTENMYCARVLNLLGLARHLVLTHKRATTMLNPGSLPAQRLPEVDMAVGCSQPNAHLNRAELLKM